MENEQPGRNCKDTSAKPRWWLLYFVKGRVEFLKLSKSELGAWLRW
jgi:hypothetical protein